MSISIGDIDIANEIVELHFQLHKTQLLLDKIILKVSEEGVFLTKEDVTTAENMALDYVSKKFPNMGIKKK